MTPGETRSAAHLLTHHTHPLPIATSARPRILVVEDNTDAAESLRLYLALSGYEVRVAHTGPTGLDAARDWNPDVILCDLGLPDLDGYGVASALRHDPATASLRLIAMSGYGSVADKVRCHEVGFDCHLTKPVEPTELLRLVGSSNQQSQEVRAERSN
jgi:two-component system CheB/CheR fusion protein